MDDWIRGACDQVDALVEKDPYYQELCARRKELESVCRKILDSLPADAREALTEYEYTIMEMAYQRTQTAYRLGKMQRHHLRAGANAK